MKILICLLFMFSGSHLFSQLNYFSHVYPIGEDPAIGYISSMVPDKETIYFEANPILRMSLFNNIQKGLLNSRKQVSAVYFAFRPQLRMYAEKSKPVKMPSYKISILGFQHMFMLSARESLIKRMLALSFESGHYSNGQSGCAFDPNHKDGSQECMDVYALINSNSNLSNLLNRENGNFSTNYTELIVKYIFSPVDENLIPKNQFSLQLGYTRYHNNLLGVADIGGYSEEDIRIYGKNHFLIGFDAYHRFQTPVKIKWLSDLDRWAYKFDYSFIHKPHVFVNPHRITARASVHFKNDVGIFLSGIYGHDNYNYRFVDSGFQFSFGMVYDVFPPVEIGY